MRNDSALASGWFWSLCHGKPDDSGRESNSRTKLCGLALLRVSWSPERPREHKAADHEPKRRVQTAKAQFSASRTCQSLTEVFGPIEVRQVTDRRNLWRASTVLADAEAYSSGSGHEGAGARLRVAY
jgi:hypothetical protein